MSIVSAHVAHTLAQYVDHVFGIMGNGNAHFLDSIERDTAATHTAMRHEAGAVVSADAYYRAGGRLAAATTTYGAGFTNTLTALAEAVQARSPLILVVGDEPTAGPRPWDVDQIAMASAVGARTYTVGRADSVSTTAIAVEHALTYRVPTVLAIPYDVARLEVGPVPAAPALTAPEPLALDGAYGRAAVAHTARLLADARRPLLLAGRGAWTAGAVSALGELADSVGALTVTSALGRNIFPRSEFDLGVAGGFGARGAMDLVRRADVVVVFGASLNQFTMRFGELFGPEAEVVQVDIAPSATNPRVGRYIRADAGIAARAMTEQVVSLGSSPSGWREDTDAAAARVYDAGDGIAADGRLDPRSAACRIGELLPADRVVVSDGGHFIGWANMYWPVQEPNRMIMVGTAYQAIGQGFPSMPGAARARPDATVVLTTGDGGGLMALADLEAAVRVTRGRGLAVVWNDRAYGAEVNVYGRQGLSPGPMVIPEVDFAGLAGAVGAEGRVVRSMHDLDYLGEWVSRPAPERPFLLLDLRISGDVIAPYQREVIRANS